MSDSIVYVLNYFDEERTVPATWVQLDDENRHQACTIKLNNETRTIGEEILGTFDSCEQAVDFLKKDEAKRQEYLHALWGLTQLLLEGRKPN